MRPALAALALAGCGDDLGADVPALAAVTLNVMGSDTIQDEVLGQEIADQLAALEPDFVMLQECVSCGALLDRMPARFALARGNEDSELGILYDASAWLEGERGTLRLAGDDGWGLREARWSMFVSVETGGPLVVYSTHWCVPIRNADDGCDESTHVANAHQLLADIADRDHPVLLGGDLNVFDTYEDAPAIRALRAGGLVDTLRAVTDQPVVTFEGNGWAPPGRIDYLLATSPVTVDAAAVAADSASDHRPVSASLDLAP